MVNCSQKKTALDIVTLMAGNTDAAVALVEDLIKKKHKFCGKDWLRLIIPKNAKIRKGKGKGRSGKKSPKGKGSGKSPPKSPPGPPPSKLPPKAPGSTQKYKGKLGSSSLFPGFCFPFYFLVIRVEVKFLAPSW